jgi:hypothetical protein
MDPEQKMVKDFHKGKGELINHKPTIIDYDTALLRLNLTSEEFGNSKEPSWTVT